MKSNKKLIYKGYNGIIDLDLTNVDPIYHKTLINDHEKDIENYKLEQSKLDPELRYENTILKVKEKMENENKILAKRFKIKKKINF